MSRPIIRWGLQWRSETALDGPRSWIVCDDGFPAMFKTRQQARDFATEKYGYIRSRPDLQKEPHGWRIPRPVRLRIEVVG